jgi:hypothetical protein
MRNKLMATYYKVDSKDLIWDKCQENDTIIQMIVLYKSQFFMLNFIFNN